MYLLFSPLFQKYEYTKSSNSQEHQGEANTQAKT